VPFSELVAKKENPTFSLYTTAAAIAVGTTCCQRLSVLIPLGVVIEVGVYTQTVTILIFITTKLTCETFKRTVNITDMEFEILFTREMTQAPRARVHTYYLAAVYA
jgi:hypothetical protein